MVEIIFAKVQKLLSKLHCEVVWRIFWTWGNCDGGNKRSHDCGQLGSGPTLLIIVSKIELSSFDIEKHQYLQNSEKALSHFTDIFGSRYVNRGSPHKIRKFVFSNMEVSKSVLSNQFLKYESTDKHFYQ